MGVDCGINLPDNVRVKDVAYVIGIASGLKVEWEPCFPDKNNSWLRVPGAEVKATNIIEMAEVFVRGDLVDGQDVHFCYYHFESSDGGRSLNPRSTAYWLAIAHRLVDFFGGSIDYQDCDDVAVDYDKPGNSRDLNSPEDGDEYWDFYKRLAAIKPITQEELRHYDKLAAYKIDER